MSIIAPKIITRNEEVVFFNITDKALVEKKLRRKALYWLHKPKLSTILSYIISGQFSCFKPPENVRKHSVFWGFRENK